MFPVGSETHGFELNEEVIDHSSAQEKAFIQAFSNQPGNTSSTIYRSDDVAKTANIRVFTSCIYTYIVMNNSYWCSF